MADYTPHRSDYDPAMVRSVLDRARSEGRTALTAPESKALADAYGIPVPTEALARSAGEAATIATDIGFPVVAKIVSPDILHKTDAGGVEVGLESADEVTRAYERITANARAYARDATIDGIQIQQQVGGGQEVLIGATTDPTFGKVVVFGLGGVLVEVLKDVSFRLAPVSAEEARAQIGDIKAAEVLSGVRGGEAVDTDRLADVITRLSDLVTDFPEISEADLNPVFASASGSVAADLRFVLDFDPAPPPARFTREEILGAMNRIFKPRSVAIIGASNEHGKIGNSVIRNVVDGGYAGEVYPINPKADEVYGRAAYPTIADAPDGIDVAIFAIPAKFVASALEEAGRKGVAGAVLIPSGFAETGEQELQDEVVAVARRHGVRLLGPNIYGYYYTPQH